MTINIFEDKAHLPKLDFRGRVIIPVSCRKIVALKTVDELIFTIENNELYRLNAKQALARVQAEVKNILKANL